MAEGWSQASATAILNSYITGFLQLHSAAPGSGGSTATAAGGVRKALTMGGASVVSNVASITTTGSADWLSLPSAETISKVSIWTLVTGGSFVISGSLTTPITVAIGDNFSVLAGNLTASIPTAF